MLRYCIYYHWRRLVSWRYKPPHKYVGMYLYKHLLIVCLVLQYNWGLHSVCSMQQWKCILNCRRPVELSLYKLSQYEKWCWKARYAGDTAAQSTGLGLQHARPLAQTSYLCRVANQTTCRLFITVVLFRSRRCNCFDKISCRFLLFEQGLMFQRAVVDLELTSAKLFGL